MVYPTINQHCEWFLYHPHFTKHLMYPHSHLKDEGNQTNGFQLGTQTIGCMLVSTHSWPNRFRPYKTQTRYVLRHQGKIPDGFLMVWWEKKTRTKNWWVPSGCFYFKLPLAWNSIVHPWLWIIILSPIFIYIYIYVFCNQLRSLGT